MYINTNSASLYARANIEKSMRNLESGLEKLSTAKKLNKAADDASGVAIAESMRKMIQGNGQSIRNMSMASDLAKVADGGLNTMTQMLHRLKEIAIQANNGTYSPKDIVSLNNEAEQIMREIEHIANNTHFNGINLLNTGNVVFDASSTIAGGAVNDGTRIVTIPPGGFVDVPFVIPPKQPQEGSKFTVNVEKVDLEKDIINRNMSMNDTTIPITNGSGQVTGHQYINLSKTQTITVPDGYVIKSAKLIATSTGDIDNSNEYTQIQVNGTQVDRQGDYYGGRSGTYDLDTIPGIVGSESFTVRGSIPTSVSNANINYRVELEYTLKDSIFSAESPSGETFGPGGQFVNNPTDTQFDYSNNSTVGASYSGGGTGVQENFTFYNPEEGTWMMRVTNPSTSQQTQVRVTGEYRIADSIPVHTGYGKDDRELFTLSNVSRDTLGIENLDISTQLGIQRINSALEIVVKERQKYGLLMSKFEGLSDYRSVETLNTEQSLSRIVDADMAKETSNVTRNKLLADATIQMLVTINQNPSNVLQAIQDLAKQ